jgi:5-(carboxyamino)imidazole ribonucleotide synthase
MDMLKPGSTIGILGGGQLGRMLAMAAAQLGLRVIGYAPQDDNVAAEVCSDFFAKGWGDMPALAALAAKCDIVTWEFENVPLSAIAAIPADLMRPGPLALETAQDRLNEKNFVQQHGGQCAPYMPVDSEEDLARAVEQLGALGILKTRREGYDGKGQWRITTAMDASAVRFPGSPCLYEGLVNFEAEFSVILARGMDGKIVFWDSPMNSHEDGMLATSKLPLPDRFAPQVKEARSIAQKTAEALNYVGVLTLEFFATSRGPIFNEMAPRVHNSGHWTIEGAVTSQFENHIRAIAGLPLGATDTRFARVEMENVVGKDAKTIFDQLSASDEVHVHHYGKSKVRAGRKMGHVTHLSGQVSGQVSVGNGESE